VSTKAELFTAPTDDVPKVSRSILVVFFFIEIYGFKPLSILENFVDLDAGPVEANLNISRVLRFSFFTIGSTFSYHMLPT
jgi:hypothetical protein